VSHFLHLKKPNWVARLPAFAGTCLADRAMTNTENVQSHSEIALTEALLSGKLRPAFAIREIL
jgi:hypothetical protein